jgi:hypothetical protein
MMALTGKPCEIDFSYEKGRQALDLRRRPGQEVQDLKDNLMVHIDECIQKVFYFQVRLEAAQAAV